MYLLLNIGWFIYSSNVGEKFLEKPIAQKFSNDWCGKRGMSLEGLMFKV
jgi:hypothetical protein